MVCKNCGIVCRDDAKFCNNCGTTFETSMNNQQQGQQAVQQPVQQPVQPQGAPSMPYGYSAQPQAPVPGPMPGAPYGYPVNPVKPSLPGKGLGIAGMVLGIVALVFFCYWPISLVCGITGIALSGVALNKAKMVGMKNGMAVAGVTCSAIALGLMILFLLLMAIGCAEMGMDMF